MPENTLHEAPDVPEPFFEDTRTIGQKLVVDKRDWMPHKADGGPPFIFGLVIERGTYISEMNARDPRRETARVLTEDNVEWSVIAFHGYLQTEFKRKDPRVGDFCAFGHLGTKPGKPGENDANVYQIEVERNPTPPPASTEVGQLLISDPEEPGDSSPEPEDTSGEQEAGGDDDIPFDDAA